MSNSGLYLRGVIEILILSILNADTCYGYEMPNIIREQSKSLLDIPLGTLYPSLYRLQESGYVGTKKKMVGKRLRTYYHIKPAGREYYQEIRKEYGDIAAGVGNILKAMDGKE